MGMALKNGQVVIPGIIHKIRSYPTGKGSTSYARFSSDMSEINEEKIKQFVSATGYVGIFDIEMIRAYKYQCKIHAYCMMTNHIHLLLETSEDEIGRFMKCLSERYAMYFNHK